MDQRRRDEDDGECKSGLDELLEESARPPMTIVHGLAKSPSAVL
jgi:hypothetical protein